LTNLARILAELVFPDPLGPTNKKAWESDPAFIIRKKDSRALPKSKSAIFSGRYF
jgi:hypothetical protein